MGRVIKVKINMIDKEMKDKSTGHQEDRIGNRLDSIGGLHQDIRDLLNE